MTLKYIVTNTNYENINQILKQEFHISSRLQHKLIMEKHIFLNNNIIDTRTKVSKNDVITVNLDFEEIYQNIVSTKIPLDILYEDEAFLVLNKPAGIAVHPSLAHYDNSLSNGVKYYYEKIGLNRKVRPVNRLDLDTSGIIIFAKNEYVQQCLIDQMNSNTFIKEYIAICKGTFKEKSGTINLPIARKENSIIERCISQSGQNAITVYELLNEFDNFSLVKCTLKTGRTHQIRVHMAGIGHPIIGDTLYGSPSNLIKRQALHSYKIAFIHPVTNKQIELHSKLPNDIQKILTKKN